MSDGNVSGVKQQSNKFGKVFGQKQPRVVARNSNESIDNSPSDRIPIIVEPQVKINTFDAGQNTNVQAFDDIYKQIQQIKQNIQTQDSQSLREDKENIEGMPKTQVYLSQASRDSQGQQIPDVPKPRQVNTVQMQIQTQKFQENFGYTNQTQFQYATSKQPTVVQVQQVVQQPIYSKFQEVQTYQQQLPNQPQPIPQVQKATFKPIQMVINNRKYVAIKQLGQGGQSQVFKVMTTDGQQYAVKRIELKNDEDDMQSRKAVQQEIQILQSVKGHDITCDLVDFEIQSDWAYIILELGDIDLKSFMRENPIISHHRIATLIEDMCMCLSKFHQLGHVHTDLKPQNFIFLRGRLKILDFGISMDMLSGSTMIVREGLIGTPKYIAPEVIKLSFNEPGGKIHRASDVWSIGVIIYELVCGCSPFDAIVQQTQKNNLKFLSIIKNGQYQINWNIKCDMKLIDLMQKCLMYDDSRRISVYEVLNHPFLKKVPIGPCEEVDGQINNFQNLQITGIQLMDPFYEINKVIARRTGQELMEFKPKK